IDAVKRYKEQQVNLAEQELKQVKSEIRTDKLKSIATDAATAIASGVGSLFGSGKLKDLEQANEKLRLEVIKRDKGIDELKVKMQQIQEQHGKQIRNLQGVHNQELEAKEREISRLNALLEKAFKWFPMFKEMLRMEEMCYAIGFTKDMINSLLTKKEAIRCNGKIYSEEHKRRFEIKNDTFKVEKSSVNDNKLVLTINRQPISEWFKEQWERLQQAIRKSVQTEKKSRGFRM
ncbi:mobilization protein, partial [Escherichia coli]|nr:mobilization protein [Escherichia coli]